MSEIKNCEEFVINELLEARTTIDRQQEKIDLINKFLDDALFKQEIVSKCLKVNVRQSDYKNMKYIDISGTIWADSEHYETILGILKERGYEFAEED